MCPLLLVVFFHPVGADVPGRRGGCPPVLLSSCRGLFVFLPIKCGLHVAVFGVSSYYMEKFKQGGVVADPVGAAAGVRFLLKKRTKKRKHGKVLTQTRKRTNIQLQTRKRVKTLNKPGGLHN